MEPWRCMVETFILNYHEKLDDSSFTLHGKRSFLKPIDQTRIPYNYRENSKTTRIRTAIKEDPKKLAMLLRT
jgi:hypothetical protein